MSSVEHIDGFDNRRLLLSLSPDEVEVLDNINCGHYYCVLWACLRYRLVLKRSGAIIAVLRSAVRTGPNILRPNGILPSCLNMLQGQNTKMIPILSLRHLLQFQAQVLRQHGVMMRSLRFLEQRLRSLDESLRRLGLVINLLDSQVPDVRRLKGIRPVPIS